MLIEDPSLFDTKLDPRVALFRTFAGLWNSVGVNLKPEMQTSALTPAIRKLESITPLPRQAFLLSAVEGFSAPDIASILGIDEDEVMELIDQAGREIARQMSTDVVVIEDEPLIALELERIVTDLGHRVVTIARTARQAIEACKPCAQARPHPGRHPACRRQLGSQRRQRDPATFSVPVIFVTAYPQRLLTGTRPEPTFLITKPFHPDTVKAIVSQALFFDRRARLRDRSSAA